MNTKMFRNGMLMAPRPKPKPKRISMLMTQVYTKNMLLGMLMVI